MAIIRMLLAQRRLLVVRAFFVSIVLLGITLAASLAAAQQVELSVDASKTGSKIDRNLFGQFA